MKHVIFAVGMCVGCATAIAPSGDPSPSSGDPSFNADSGKHDAAHDAPFVPDTSVEPDTSVDAVDANTCASCDLADSSACSGSVCGWDSSISDTKCGYALGTGQQGAACGGSVACAAGYVCVTPANQCQHWCKYPSGSCPLGTTCSGKLASPPLVCGVTYAICQ